MEGDTFLSTLIATVLILGWLYAVVWLGRINVIPKLWMWLGVGVALIGAGVLAGRAGLLW